MLESSAYLAGLNEAELIVGARQEEAALRIPASGSYLTCRRYNIVFSGRMEELRLCKCRVAAFRREVLTKRYHSPVLTVQSEWRVLPAVANYTSVEERGVAAGDEQRARSRLT